MHQHAHGEHFHNHEHTEAYDHLLHDHGWHSPAATCTGDDTFGHEEKVRQIPSDYVRTQVRETLEDFKLASWPTILVTMPYVPGMLRMEVVNAAGEGWSRAIDVSGSEYDYWAMLDELWRWGEDFVVLEHDVVPPAGWLSDFLACPHFWCIRDYSVFAGEVGDVYGPQYAPLGCTRFRGFFAQRYPDLISRIENRTWSTLDAAVCAAMHGTQTMPHRHTPAAMHLHNYNAAEALNG